MKAIAKKCGCIVITNIATSNESHCNVIPNIATSKRKLQVMDQNL